MWQPLDFLCQCHQSDFWLNSQFMFTWCETLCVFVICVYNCYTCGLPPSKGRFTQFSGKNFALFCTHLPHKNLDASFWWIILIDWIIFHHGGNNFPDWIWLIFTKINFKIDISVRKELVVDFSAPWSCLHTKNLDWTVATLLQIYAQTNEQFNFETILKLCLPLII